MPYASMAMRPSAPIPNLGMPLHPGYAALMQQQQMSMGMQGMGMQGMGTPMATLPFNPLPGQSACNNCLHNKQAARAESAHCCRHGHQGPSATSTQRT